MDSTTSDIGDFQAMADCAPNTPAWSEQLTRTTFPALAGDFDADVCVIGLGGSGLSCIHELLRLGKRVIGVDAGNVADGAAGRNGGFLLAGTAEFYHKAVVELGRLRARNIYQLTVDEIGRISTAAPGCVRRRGSLRIAASNAEEDDCDSELEAMLTDGFAVDAYRGPEGTGLFFPRDAVFNPFERCQLLAQHAAERGAVLCEQTRVISLGDGKVNTSHGRIRSDRTIVAVDGRIEVLLPELGDRVRTARLQMLATGPASEVDFPYPVYRRWGYDYWQQLPDGRVVLGGCRDLFEEAEWTTDADPTGQVQESIESVLRTVLGVQQPVTHRWAASVGYTGGILPLMEEPQPGVWAIGGYNGTGNLMGSIYGRMVAQVAVTGRSELREMIIG